MAKEIIQSEKNDKIKNLIKLRKAGPRKKTESIIIEGSRELELAQKAGYLIKELFYNPNLFKNQALLDKAYKDGAKIHIVDHKIMGKISYKEKPEGILGLASPRHNTLKDLKLSKNPLLFVLESVEKPGNLGAILRTAHALKIEAVIINDPQTDIYNPNVLRASMGHIFTIPTIVAGSEETIKWLKENKIKALGATTKSKKYCFQSNLKKSVALIFGTESLGLSQKWLKSLDEEIKIPMQKGIDSLNVSNSAAIMAYEAQRQREFIDF